MIPERITVADGVYLNIIECDKFKTNCVSVDFVAEISEERAAELALLPFVLIRGTKELTTMTELTKKLDMLYGSRVIPSVSKAGSVQRFGFRSFPLRSEYADGLDVSLEILSLIGDMIYSPYLENGLLSKQYTESEKKIMLDRIDAQINDKGSYSLLRCREIMSNGDSYSIPETGTREAVTNITPEALTNALKFARTSLRTEIFCIGSFDKNSLIEKVKEIFTKEARNTPKPIKFSYQNAPEKAKEVTEKQAVKQGKLCLGFATNSRPDGKDAAAFTLFSEVLSGSPTAKLFMNVREKMSLCYYCTAVSDINRGLMIIASGIDIKDKASAEKAVLKELDDCKNGLISDEELSAAKRSLSNTITSIYDDSGAMRSWYLSRIITNTVKEPSDFLNEIMSLEVGDIMRVSEKLKLDTVYFLTADNEGGEA